MQDKGMQQEFQSEPDRAGEGILQYLQASLAGSGLLLPYIPLCIYDRTGCLYGPAPEPVLSDDQMPDGPYSSQDSRKNGIILTDILHTLRKFITKA